MAVVQLVAPRQPASDCRLRVATGTQVAFDRRTLGGAVLQAQRWARQQWLADVSDTAQAPLLDETQLVGQLESLAGGLVESARGKQRLAAEQPVPGQAGGETEQKVEIQVRAQRRAQLAVIQAHEFVGIHRLAALRCRQQVQRRHQQAADSEFDARFDQEQPVGIKPGKRLVDRRHRPHLWIEEHRSVPRTRAQRREQVALDTWIRIDVLQALQGTLHGLGIAVGIEHQHREARPTTLLLQESIDQHLLHRIRPPRLQPGRQRDATEARRPPQRGEQVDRLEDTGVQAGDRCHPDEAVVAGLAIPTQFADSQAEVGMALLADTGLVTPDLAELLAGDAETGQRPRQERQVATL